MTPLLSVIIPVYNAEKYLKKSIDSVLNQTFKDFELILVDDGSSDGSLAICKEYEKKDGRVTALSQKNAGAGPARNAGIEAAKGKYMAFSDADDYLLINAYEVCISKIEETNADLLVFGVKTDIYDENGNKTESVEEKIPATEYDNQKDCRENWVYLRKNMNMNSPCNKIYRSSVIKENDLKFPDLRRMQDCVFNMRYYDKIFSFVSVADNFFVRTWHGSKTEQKKIPENIIDIAAVYHKTGRDLLKSWGIRNESDYLHFDKWFSEFVVVNEELYVQNTKGFLEGYKYCKKINSTEYVKSFFSEYRNKSVLNKRENAIARRHNLMLALYYYLNKNMEKGRE